MDATAAIQAALDYAASLPYKGTVCLPDGLYVVTAPIRIPNGVSVWCSPGWTDAAGTAWWSGVGLWKAHGGHGVIVDDFNDGTYIRGLSVWSNPTTWATGDGYRVGRAHGVSLISCNVFECGGRGFTLGDGSGTSWTINPYDCFARNCGAQGFYIDSPWCKGERNVVQGCTVGVETTTSCNNWSWGESHMEGFLTHAYWLRGSSYGVFFGRNIILPYDSSLTCVRVTQGPVGGGGAEHILSGLRISLPPPAVPPPTGVGVSIEAGTARTILLDSLIESAGIGCRISSAAHDQLHRTLFYHCELPILADSDPLDIHHCMTQATQGAWSISFVSGTRGTWSDNDLDTPIQPVAAGSNAGFFNGIRVCRNRGYVTRSSLQTAAIAPNTPIAHGLVWTPDTDIGLTCYTGNVTSAPNITAAGPVTVAWNWNGTNPAQWGCKWHCQCDF